MTTRRFLPVAACILAAVVGCTSIPTSGPVVSAEIETGLANVDFDLLPPGPSAGANPEEILAGFIAAGTAAQDNYRVARSYLAAETAENWNPNATVLIRAGEADTVVLAEDTARYVVPVSASVDELGRYSESQTQTDQTLDFRFTRATGEWRISSLPDGIVLSEAAFAEGFASYRLYYFSPGYRELVPDIRWFATRGELPSKIVRALLEPPSFWLDQGATVSAFPQGTQLAVSPVSVIDGVARVDLTTPVLAAGEIGRQRMLLQLTSSLAQVRGISSATISVNQSELVINPLGEDGPILASGRDSRTVVLQDRRFGFLQGGRIEPAEGLSALVANLVPQRLFYSPSLDEVLATRPDGLWRVQEGREPVLVDPRTGLVRGVLDNCGYAWSSTAQSSPEMMAVYGDDGVAQVLPLDIGQEAELVSFELARDDTRMLLLVQNDAGARVVLTAVTRGNDCTAVGFAEFLELGVFSGRGVDAAWIDDSRVAVALVDDVTGVGEVFVIDSSGRAVSIGRPMNPQTLVGGVGGIAGLRLLATDGSLYQPRGNGWQATGDRATVLVTQR